MKITVAPHPELEVAAFVTQFPAPLGELGTPDAVRSLFAPDATAPLSADDAVRQGVRQLLKVGGFKPTGRSKPASEYLRNAVLSGALGPGQSINLAVDVCNAVSLHSGLPVSVVDLERGLAPWAIAIAPDDTEYVFNASGQVIQIAGCVALRDGEGWCAGPVKDAHRTKTHAGTVRTLSVVWGTTRLPGRTAEAVAWYRRLVESQGATTALASPAA